MEEHASSMQDFDLWAVALACADLGRRHQLGAGRVGHGSLSPEILGPFLIITIGSGLELCDMSGSPNPGASLPLAADYEGPDWLEGTPTPTGFLELKA